MDWTLLGWIAGLGLWLGTGLMGSDWTTIITILDWTIHWTHKIYTVPVNFMGTCPYFIFFKAIAIRLKRIRLLQDFLGSATITILYQDQLTYS